MSPKEKAALARENLLQSLIKKLGFVEQKVQKKVALVGSATPSDYESPSGLKRLTKWLEQIAGLRQKEVDIISEIKEVEEKHHLLRKEKRLRKARPSSKEEQNLAHENEGPKERSWLWFLLLLGLFDGNKQRPKPKNE